MRPCLMEYVMFIAVDSYAKGVETKTTRPNIEL